MNKRKGFVSVPILIFVFAGLLVSSGILYVSNRNVVEQKIDANSPYEYPNIWATSTSETNDWKTYRNEEYGFEFEYPTNWKLDGFSNASVIFSPDFVSRNNNYAFIESGSIISVANYGQTYRDDSRDSLDELVKAQTDRAPGIISEYVKVNDRNGVKFEHSVGENNNTHTVVIIVKGGEEFIIDHEYKENSEQPSKDVFAKIISTLKFTK